PKYAQDRAEGSAVTTIERLDRAGPLPVSPAQERLWLLGGIEGPSPAYNEFRVFRLPPGLDVELLRRCLNELVRRHEVLRTHFAERDGAVVQVIRADGLLQLESHECADEADFAQAVYREIHLPFDLTRDMLIRARLLETSNTRWLVLTAHHMITDGESMRLFMKELDALYRAWTRDLASELPPVALQHADYAHWQRRRLQEVPQSDLQYWGQ